MSDDDVVSKIVASATEEWLRQHEAHRAKWEAIREEWKREDEFQALREKGMLGNTTPMIDPAGGYHEIPMNWEE
jgi:hypothetical protein